MKQASMATGFSVSQVSRIMQKAKDRGFNKDAVPCIVLMKHVSDELRSGRPHKVEPEALFAELQTLVRKNRATREMSLEDLALAVGSSATVVRMVMKKLGFKKLKITTKPGLNDKQKAARLKFCRLYEHWTLEDWKRVIWSDETSVVLGQKRGTTRVWRTSNEAYEPSVTRRRWKGYSAFMFWGCFNWYGVGPSHIFKKETTKEKAAASKDIEARNALLEPLAKDEWELNTPMTRLRVDRGNPGPKPGWKFTEQNGKLVRRSKAGGIDWYRYQIEILVDKVIPFYQRVKDEWLRGEEPYFMDDGAPSHIHSENTKLLKLKEIQTLFWPGNSPDLNAIEPAWFWLKRTISRKGAPRTGSDAAKIWHEAWKNASLPYLQSLIERIPVHIKKIIELEGGNEYKEGREYLTGMDDRRMKERSRRARNRSRQGWSGEDGYESVDSNEPVDESLYDNSFVRFVDAEVARMLAASGASSR